VLTRHAVDVGCGGVLMLPPFYYKAPNEEGLFRFFAEVIEGVGDDRLKVYLYHIPPVAQVGFSLALIGRLIKAFPDTVVGLKDSSGDWSNTAAILEAYPAIRSLSGFGNLPVGWPAQGRGRLHLRHLQRQRCGNPQRL
jgi:4-hydroxy-tetrahydrodipicolinate synthase